MTTYQLPSGRDVDLAAVDLDQLSFDELRALGDSAREHLTGLEADANDIHDRAGDKALTPGQQQRFDNLARGIRSARSDADRIREAQNAAMMRGIQSGQFALGGGTIQDHHSPSQSSTGGDVFRRSAGDAESTALRRVDELHRTAAIADHAAETVSTLVRTSRPEAGFGRNLAADWAVVAGDDHYREAFAKLVQDPTRGHLEWTSDEHAAYQRAQILCRGMTLGDTAGGHMIPLTLDPAIHLTGDGSISAIRRIARSVTTMTDTWKGITSAGATAEWKNEGDEVADGSPTLAGPSITTHLFDCFVPFTVEIQMDARDFEDEIRRTMFDAVDQLHAAAWINGSGNGQPIGIITALDGGSSEVTPGSSETFAASTDVYRVAEALRPRSKSRAQWVAADSTINEIAQAETSNGARLFPEVTDGRLLRRALNEDSNMDQASAINAGATADNHVLLYGDFGEYVIANRAGSRVELVPHLFGTANNLPTLQRGFVLWGRVGADVLVDQAFAVLNVATTA